MRREVAVEQRARAEVREGGGELREERGGLGLVGRGLARMRRERSEEQSWRKRRTCPAEAAASSICTTCGWWSERMMRTSAESSCTDFSERRARSIAFTAIDGPPPSAGSAR